MAEDTVQDQKEKNTETNWPITTDDLYGPSKPSEAPLVYEETPLIEPHNETESLKSEQVSDTSEITKNTEDKRVQQDPVVTYTIPAQRTKPNFFAIGGNKKPTLGGCLANIVTTLVLFGLGVAASMLLRGVLTGAEFRLFQIPSITIPFLNSAPTNDTPVSKQTEVSPTPQTDINQEPTNEAPVENSTDWVTYKVISGKTKQPIPGLQFRLPVTVQAPVCDRVACASQGTILPGGTRFTIAARGVGQLLPDPRGKILTDASGKKFTVQETTFSGKKVTEFTADFTGSTSGGFGFIRMRGVMIEVSDALAVELNHFTPVDSKADFKSDDSLFNEIVGSFVIE